MATKKTVQQKKVSDNATIKVETKKGAHKPRVHVLVEPETIVGQKVVGGFIGFLRERAVVGLAIGFVVATQMQALIKQLIASFLDPLTKLLFSQKLSAKTFTLQFHGRSADFEWGQFIYAFIYFLFVIFAIYVIIKIFQLDKLDQPKK